DQSSHYSFLLYQHTSRPEPYTLSLHDALPIWQLKRFDIKVKGAGSDPVEKFFRTADSAVLFPEYIARSVRQGMEEANLLPAITAATTRFEGMDYRSITAEAGGGEKELKAVDEGAAIPATTIKVQANLV